MKAVIFFPPLCLSPLFVADGMPGDPVPPPSRLAKDRGRLTVNLAQNSTPRCSHDYEGRDNNAFFPGGRRFLRSGGDAGRITTGPAFFGREKPRLLRAGKIIFLSGGKNHISFRREKSYFFQAGKITPLAGVQITAAAGRAFAVAATMTTPAPIFLAGPVFF
jgi:hypothetical protein